MLHASDNFRLFVGPKQRKSGPLGPLVTFLFLAFGYPRDSRRTSVAKPLSGCPESGFYSNARSGFMPDEN